MVSSATGRNAACPARAVPIDSAALHRDRRIRASRRRSATKVSRDVSRNVAQTADADGDGHRAAECGGDDCDDSDHNRFPGNSEVCDALHDEDCDLATVGTRDMDGDGFQSNACCNAVLGNPTVCGNDCDDSLRSVNPQAPEVCDGIDNNCNGVIDEGLSMLTWYPDCDGDLFGDHAATGMPGCAPPTTMPMCSVPHIAG